MLEAYISNSSKPVFSTTVICTLIKSVIFSLPTDADYCFFAYVSIRPGTMWRCHGCHHMALAQESHLGLLSCRSTGVPEPARQWASRLHPEPASSPAGRYLRMISGAE